MIVAILGALIENVVMFKGAPILFAWYLQIVQ